MTAGVTQSNQSAIKRNLSRVTMIPYGDDMNRVQETVCTFCGETKGHVTITGRQLPNEVFLAKLQQHGWWTNKRGTKRKCPACIEKQIKERQAQKEERMKTATIKTQEKQPEVGAPLECRRVDLADVAAKIDRAARRRIFRAIDDNYGDDAYIHPATDRSIAESLDVPWAHVAAIREAEFGPAGDSPQKVALQKEIADLKMLTEQAMTNAMDVAEHAEGLGKRLDALEAKVKEIT